MAQQPFKLLAGGSTPPGRIPPGIRAASASGPARPLGLRPQPVEREPQPEQRRVQITPVLVVQFVRVGYLRDQLQGVADVLCRRLFCAALGPAAAVRGAPLVLSAPVPPIAALGGGA